MAVVRAGIIRDIAVMGKAAGRAVEQVEAALRAHPEPARDILEYRPDAPPAQTGGICRVMPITRHLTRAPVEATEPRRAADPQETGCILPDVPHDVVLAGIRRLRLDAVMREVKLPRIETVYPMTERAKPESASAVLEEREQLVVAEAARVVGGVAIVDILLSVAIEPVSPPCVPTQ